MLLAASVLRPGAPCGLLAGLRGRWPCAGAKVPTWPAATLFQRALCGRATGFVASLRTRLPARCAGGTSAPGRCPPRIPTGVGRKRPDVPLVCAAPPTRALPWTHRAAARTRGGECRPQQQRLRRPFLRQGSVRFGLLRAAVGSPAERAERWQRLARPSDAGRDRRYWLRTLRIASHAQALVEPGVEGRRMPIDTAANRRGRGQGAICNVVVDRPERDRQDFGGLLFGDRPVRRCHLFYPST